MARKGLIVTALFIGLLVIAGPWACASKTTVQNSFNGSAYQQSAELQKQKEAAADEGTMKKLSAMTSVEYERLGDSYFQQGSLDMAYLQYMHAMSSAQPDSAQNSLRFKIGRLYLKKGIIDEAIAEFESILKYNANDATAYEGLGMAYSKAKDMKKAEENYLKALNLDPKLWVSRNTLGVLYDRLGRFDEAIAQYEAAILIQPASASLFNNLGMAYLYKGQYDASVRSFYEALRLQGSNPIIYNNLALALYKTGNHKEALEAFKKAGSESTALNNLGYLLMVNGNTADAIKYLQGAIETDPRYYAKAHENMEQAQAQAKSQSLIK